jgi:ribose transport system substrate-binding protein
MSIRRVIINTLVIITALIIFYCWYNSCIKDVELTSTAFYGKNQQAKPEVKKDYKIYLITNEKAPQFWEYMNQGVSDMAKLLGLSFTWEAPAIQDVNQQIELLNQVVDSGADAILISVLSADELTEPIRQVKEKGVKIIYVNSPSNEKGIITLATNNYEAGKKAAENMIEELELAGLQEGTIGIVSVLKENPTIIERDSGFMDVIKADKRFTVLDPVYTGGDPKLSEEAATALIKKHPELVAIFGSNEGASIGVGNAIMADNNRIIGVAFDKSDATMELLNKDSIKVIIAQNPYSMGYLGMAEAYAALQGFDTGPSYIDTRISVIRER